MMYNIARARSNVMSLHVRTRTTTKDTPSFVAVSVGGLGTGNERKSMHGRVVLLFLPLNDSTCSCPPPPSPPNPAHSLRSSTNRVSPSRAVFRYYFDTDRVTQTRFGERRSMLSLAQPGQASGLVITSTMPTADHEVHLVEVRELIDGGMAHTQVRRYGTAPPGLLCFCFSRVLITRTPVYPRARGILSAFEGCTILVYVYYIVGVYEPGTPSTKSRRVYFACVVASLSSRPLGFRVIGLWCV